MLPANSKVFLNIVAAVNQLNQSLGVNSVTGTKILTSWNAEWRNKIKGAY